MNAAQAIATLRRLRTPAFTTADAAVALGQRLPSAASQTLRRLEQAGLAVSIRRGLWSLELPSDPYALVEHITSPYPAYLSLQSALYLHGMIEQIPGVIYAASPARTARIATAVATYSVHHLAPNLFGGFQIVEGTRHKLASPEKAIVDLLYLSGTRRRLFRSFPELTLPRRFSRARAREWIARIQARRLRRMVEERFEDLLARAARP